MPVPKKTIPSAIGHFKLSREQLQALNKDSTFHSLPPELRNMVYKHALTSTPRIYTAWMDMPAVLQLSGTVEDDSMSSNGIPSWLLTCDLTFFEGRAVLRETFNLTIGPHFMTEIISGRRPSLQVVTVSSTKSLTVRTSKLGAEVDTVGVRFHLGTFGLSTLEHLSTYLSLEKAVMGRQLRRLCLQAEFVNICPVCQSRARSMYLNAHQHTTWRMDLSCLESYGLNLDSFELQVQNLDTRVAHDGYAHVANYWDEVEPCLEKEVERVGEILTGDHYGALSKYTNGSTACFSYE